MHGLGWDLLAEALGGNRYIVVPENEQCDDEYEVARFKIFLKLQYRCCEKIAKDVQPLKFFSSNG